MKEHYLYKYVYNNEIIYIGKTNSNLKQRINAHKTEDKFQPYVKECSIYIMELSNATEVNTLEALLINKYSPTLNVVDKHETVTSFEIKEPEWEEYKADKKYYHNQTNKTCTKTKKRLKTQNIYIDKLQNNLERIQNFKNQLDNLRFKYDTLCQLYASTNQYILEHYTELSYEEYKSYAKHKDDLWQQLTLISKNIKPIEKEYTTLICDSLRKVI